MKITKQRQGKIKLIILTAIAFAGNSFSSISQVKIGDNALSISSRSILEMETLDKGMLIPRITTTARNAVTGWTEGHLIYNKTEKCLQVFNGTSWECLNPKEEPWYSTQTYIPSEKNSDSVYILGKVGVADSTPTYQLDVNGKVGMRDFQLLYHAEALNGFIGSLFVGDGGNNLLNNINSEGLYNTGIGIGSMVSNSIGSLNTSAGYLSLHKNDSGTFNTSIGAFSQSFNKSGSGNSSIGVYSLYNNTIGRSNSACGAYALNTNTSGDNNSAMGSHSLYSNTSGDNNTAIGQYSMYYNKTGKNNTSAGASALYNNTTGSFNTAIGMYAMRLSTTGYSNTAIGYYSLITNSSGYFNTATGRESMKSNTSGHSNTANGVYCLHYNSTGRFNTSIGKGALFANSTGDYNTAAGFEAAMGPINGNTQIIGNASFGYKSGRNLTTGANYNSLFGFQAGDNLTTGSRNIIIGYNVDALSSTNDDQLNIGNSIYGDLVTGNIGIGATIPARKLHIDGAIRLVTLSSPPSNPIVGDLYMDDGTNTSNGSPKLLVYDGTNWNEAW